MSRPALTKQQKDINPDPAYWDHFDQWWDKDFSWLGLKTHKINNHHAGDSLQDYWREEATSDRLIEFAGKEWTRFHLPPHDKDGNKSEKGDGVNWEAEKWLNWRRVITDKLQDAKPYNAVGLETRAQLQGVCFPSYFGRPENPSENETNKFKTRRTLHINAEWSRFGNHTKFQHAIFGNNSNFQYVSFGDSTNFQYATFGDSTNFSLSTFGAETIFTKAKLGENVSFYNTYFDGRVSFHDTQFAAGLFFRETNFKGLTQFHNCTFHSDTSFANAKFDIPVLKLSLLKDIWRTVTGKHEAEEAEAYESAFRILRQHMEGLRNHELEMKFGRLEMQSRERRYGSPDVRLLVRILSRGYGFISDYGQSISKPFAGLLLAPILAAFFYWLISGAGFVYADVKNALAFAFQYSLPPISMAISGFFEPNIDGTFTNALLAKPFCTGLVMTVHGISSLGMLFFLILALKRRFQIR